MENSYAAWLLPGCVTSLLSAAHYLGDFTALRFLHWRAQLAKGKFGET